MNSIFSKITDYEIFDRLFPGFLIYLYLTNLFNISTDFSNLSISSTIMLVVLSYFVGLTISRIGSLTIEPLAKKTGLIRFRKDFYQAERNDPKIKVLLKDFNMYRNIAASIAIAIIVTFVKNIFSPLSRDELVLRIIILTLLFVVFLAAYSKQSTSINNRVKYAKKGISQNNEKNDRL